MRMSSRSIVVVGGVAAVLVVAALAFRFGPLGKPDPAWRKALAATPPMSLDSPTRRPLEHHRMMVRTDELLRADSWGEREVVELEALAAVPLDPRSFADDRTVAEDGPSTIRQGVVVAVGERLKLGAPIEPAMRARVEKILIDALEHPEPDIRGMAAGVALYARLAKREDFRRRLESMRDDPDPFTALVVRNGLAGMDKASDAARGMDPGAGK